VGNALTAGVMIGLGGLVALVLVDEAVAAALVDRVLFGLSNVQSWTAPKTELLAITKDQ